MNYSYKLENDILLVSLQGRLDTEASAKFEVEFTEISKENPHGSLVIDASELEYIASSGLRIMLKMVKTEKNFKIENVSPAVYNVFEVTGFSKIIHMTKALRKIFNAYHLCDAPSLCLSPARSFFSITLQPRNIRRS